MWDFGVNLGIMFILLMTFICIWIFARAAENTLQKILAFIVSIENQTVQSVSRPPSVQPEPKKVRAPRVKNEPPLPNERLPKIGKRLEEKEKLLNKA
jgi:hypothetical protein